MKNSSIQRNKNEVSAGTKRGQGGKGDWETIKSSVVKGKGTWVSCACIWLAPVHHEITMCISYFSMK